MYVAVIPNRNSKPTILVRKGIRIGPNQVKKQTLANITQLPDEVVQQIRIILRGGTAFESFQDAVTSISNKPHGHVAAVLGVMKQLGLPQLIDSKESRNRRLVMGLLAARVLKPKSKLATSSGLDARYAADTLNESLGLKCVDADDLYEAMDYLVERKSAIEGRLAKRHLKEGSLVLCDITSSYVEGEHNELAAYGYNRDHKQGKKQIVFGLLTDPEGCPVATEVFTGNTADPTTVAVQVNKLQQAFKLKSVVMVGDRGLLTHARLREDIKPLGLGWITAMRRPEIHKLVETKDLQLDLFDERDLMTFTSDAYPDERLVVCRNPVRAKKSRQQRKELLEKTEAALDKIVQAVRRKHRPLRGAPAIGLRVGQVLGRWKMKKHFDLVIKDDHFTYTRKAASIKKAAALDGIYVIRTSLKEAPESAEVVAHYKRLSTVESAFRALKSVSLKVRPIHHRRKNRVIGHVFLCMLAYHVEYHLRQALAPMLLSEDDHAGKANQRESVIAPAKRSKQAEQKVRTQRTSDGDRAMSYSALMDHLSGVCRHVVEPKFAAGESNRFVMMSELTPTQQRAFKLLNVKVQ